MDQLPFAAKDELYRKLCITSDQHLIQRRPEPTLSISSTEKTTTKRTMTEKTYLPGQPRIALQDPYIGTYLESELTPRDLNKLAPHLWLVAKQDDEACSVPTLLLGQLIT